MRPVQFNAQNDILRDLPAAIAAAPLCGLPPPLGVRITGRWREACRQAACGEGARPATKRATVRPLRPEGPAAVPACVILPGGRRSSARLGAFGRRQRAPAGAGRASVPAKSSQPGRLERRAAHVAPVGAQRPRPRLRPSPGALSGRRPAPVAPVARSAPLARDRRHRRAAAQAGPLSHRRAAGINSPRGGRSSRPPQESRVFSAGYMMTRRRTPPDRPCKATGIPPDAEKICG